MQVGIHAGGRLVSDLDGVLQQALWDEVGFGCGRWLGAQEHAIVLMTADAVALNAFVQAAQPFSHQVDVLSSHTHTHTHTHTRLFFRGYPHHICGPSILGLVL